MTCFKYKNPLGKGYTKIDVDHKEWNKRFLRGYRFTWGKYVDVYHHPERDCFYIEWYHRLWVKAVYVVIYPLALLLYGICNYKEITEDFNAVIFQRKNGTFTSLMVYSGTEQYLKIKRCSKW